MGSTAISSIHSSYKGMGSNTRQHCKILVNIGVHFIQTQGYNNIGYALYSNTTGYYNTAIGPNAFYANTTGYNNTALGGGAGRYGGSGTTAKTTGNNSVFIGYNSRASANGVDNEIVIGYNAVGKGANTVRLGNSSVTKAYVGDSELAKQSEVDSLATAIENGITKVLRSRPSGTSLTSVGLGNATTGNSIPVSSSLSPGDTIMIEVLESLSNSHTPKIVSVTLGSALTSAGASPNSTDDDYITSFTTWNGTTMSVYSFTVRHYGSTLYFGSKKENLWNI